MSASSSTHSEIPLSERGPAPRNVVVSFGFWLFLLSDIVIFAALFAAFAVLSHETAGGPSGDDLFDRNRVLLETAILLASSFTCGLMSLTVEQRKLIPAVAWGAATFLLGATFVGMELSEFHGMIESGAGPDRSAFLSAFFALVGTHGLHVSAGLFWLLVMFAQVLTLGFRPMVLRRLRCFSLFWHALDIVWIGVFTIVYLGAR
ncbi:cytochrome o ubiquinol oxidase subunit III [Phyllobacterium zundukense]|uniref:Cytochrome o ubiquinol oxidase subunit III n=1 Tax=Phyllobacterium zundukense TaxID=1867719 RepID=A0ACD4D935_9HYPH|nr:cytochrome o ubiquinol oxidase subunit III [Phyllobacterium zundukense]UXN62289.1 cytochrome o ubiquinol oxidase subunit III [Phyllobacterium zundukense]